MKIAIDLTQIPANKTGIGIYAVNMIREMFRLNNDSAKFHFVFFVQDDDNELLELVDGQPHTTLVPIKNKRFRKLIFRFFFEQFILPSKCRKLKVDLIFSTHYMMPYFTRAKRVVAFHDMTFYLFPQLHRKVKLLYFKALIPLSVKKCDAMITVSEATKQDVLKRFPALPPDKMEVIHHGVVPFLKIGGFLPSDCLGKYGLEPQRYFLFVGTLEPRKNIAGLIKAFHHLRQSGEEGVKQYRLVIVGKKGWFWEEIFETVQTLQLEDVVVFTGYASEEEKQVLLLNAFLFLYPSFYEGFGIPILEAMASGIPVITGNTSALPEVAGDAGILVPPPIGRKLQRQ